MQLCFLLPSFNIVYAGSIVSYLPEEINKLKLNMSVSEYNKYLPDSKPFIKNHNYVFYSLKIKKDNLWDNAVCVFDDDKLTYISLVVIETNNKLSSKHFVDAETVACTLINKISEDFGKISKKYIIENKDSEIYYEPLMIWENDNFIVELSYTPSKLLYKIKCPNISLSFMKKGTDNFRFHPKIITRDNSDITFDSILNEKVKKVLYKNNTK